MRRLIWVPPVFVVASVCRGASSGVTVKLEHGPVAKLVDEMMFMMTVTSVRDAPAPNDALNPSKEAGITFSLSPGLSSAEPDWRVETIAGQGANYSRDVVFKANVPQTFAIQVRLDQPGEHWVQATAGYGNPGNRAGLDSLYLKIDHQNMRVQRSPFSK
jgi:hypothetical protein